MIAKLLRRIAIAHPRAGLALSSRIGYWGHGLLTRKPLPSLEDLSAVFGELEPRRARRLRRELASLDDCNRVCMYLIRNKGMDSVLPLLRVDAEPLERLLEENTPVIVIAWHLGPPRHMMATLQKLGVKALMVVKSWNTASEAFDQLEVRSLDSDGHPAAFLKHALEVLKTGGVVGMAMDGGSGERHSNRYLGRPIEIGRGAASLARLTGARLVPVTARWIGHSGRWETRLHPPIPEPQVDRKQVARFEAELLDATVGWFDDFTRQNPGLIRVSWSNNPFERLR